MPKRLLKFGRYRVWWVEKYNNQRPPIFDIRKETLDVDEFIGASAIYIVFYKLFFVKISGTKIPSNVIKFRR